MNRTLILALLGTISLACTPKDDSDANSETQPADDDMGTTVVPSFDPSAGNTGGGTTGMMGGSSSDGMADTTGVVFVGMPDGANPINECDIWEQDCPEGEKCMPWANDGGNSWNATRCSEVDDSPGQVGDECMVDGNGVSGLDDCDVSSMCYYVDPETNVGTCVGFCEGSEDAPTCEPGFLCTIANSGVLILCRRECDPLLQDCQGSATCLQSTGTNGFVCIVDASGEGGAIGDACAFINSCDPGLYCENPEGVPGCGNNEGCCSNFCDLTDMNPDDACTLMDQVCTAWFPEGMAPPGLEHVGGCALPAM